MASKTAVKALLDSFGIAVKADIDNTLPAGVNITGGALDPVAGTWQLKILASDAANAAAIAVSIRAALTSAGRPMTVIGHGNRKTDVAAPVIYIGTTTGNYQITLV